MTVSKRLADLSMRLSSGHYREVVNLLKAQGKDVTVNGGEIIVKFPDGSFTCGLCLSLGPLDQLPSLCFALFGPMWPLALGKDFDKAVVLIKQRLNKLRILKKRVNCL